MVLSGGIRTTCQFLIYEPLEKTKEILKNSLSMMKFHSLSIDQGRYYFTGKTKFNFFKNTYGANFVIILSKSSIASQTYVDIFVNGSDGLNPLKPQVSTLINPLKEKLLQVTSLTSSNPVMVNLKDSQLEALLQQCPNGMLDNEKRQRAYESAFSQKHSGNSVENKPNQGGIFNFDDLENNFSRFSWQDMERIVGLMFQNMGYDVKVTGKSGDFGIDVEARNDKEFLGIQVKHWKSDVDFDTVAKTLGVSQKFNKTIIISTKSGFTNQAIQHQKNNSYVLELWDSSRFKQECRLRLMQVSDERLFYNQGNEFANQSRLEEAITYFDKALKINPNFLEALYNKATAMMNLEKYNEALPIFEKVLKLNPHAYDAKYNMGGVLLKLGRYDECLPIFEDATILEPERAGAWYSKGTAWLMMNGLEDALNCYDQATRINPDYTEAWYLRGSTYHKLEKYSDAVESYERALKLNPNHIEARGNMGNALFKLGRLEEALTCYNKVLEIDPNNEDAKSSKKEALEKLGKT